MKEINNLPRYFITEGGRVWSDKTKQFMKLRTERLGYQSVVLYSGRRTHKFRVHRLVADTYIPNPDNLPLVCHKDDNPANNHVDNLFWGTQQDNMTDMVNKKRQMNGSKHHFAKINEWKAFSIRQLHAAGLTKNN